MKTISTSLLIICYLLSFQFLQAQTNMLFTNPAIDDVLKGNYDPMNYLPAEVIDVPETVSTMIHDNIQPDSLKDYLLNLSTFRTRNTGSDTLSAAEGIGAARSWILSKFEQFSERRESRLLTGYFQFDQDVCGMGRHKNVVAVLPGRDQNDPSFILIEGHMDSRCADRCDIDCTAEGMEDNGSGTALVMELARVMSQFVFDHTIVFMTTTGEEQGLIGANAFAEYATQEGLDVKAVFNNDIVGGIICGETSSPPSCPGLNHIDSTQVRLFSNGSSASLHKGLCRFIKLQYTEMLEPMMTVPMMLTLMSAEDRTGRGGDHIPFRQRGFPAMRFTSANEHGSADVDDPEYDDRQHTSDDILGVDTDGDQVIDSFFVDFNYLARNAAINGNAAAMAAMGPNAPTILDVSQNGEVFFIDFDDPDDVGEYVIGLRYNTHDFDTLYHLSGATTGFFPLEEQDFTIYLSVATVDSNGVESLFSREAIVILSDTEEVTKDDQRIRLLQNAPNPFDESTYISFYVTEIPRYREAYIHITNAVGQPVKQIPVSLREGLNEVLFRHGYAQTGTLFYSLVVDDKIVETRRMQFMQ